MNTILAVDKDINVHEQMTAEWEKYGIRTQRASTMSEAISLLANGEKYIYIIINEDSIPDFLSQIQIMRNITDTPIFAITSNCSVEKEIKALQKGVDSYNPFGKSHKETAISIIELLKATHRWSSRCHESLPVLTGGKIVLSPSQRVVFVEDTKVPLTKNEFEVLHYLMVNRGNLVPHTRLLKAIWGDDYGACDTPVLWQTIDRLRKKLSQISSADKHIIVERSIGYMFSLD
ncbi:MAG: response regulator transcription factor [Clostridiales bacterium]|nr:response regulator transcription factor [Clostridiales bacterium]